MIKYLNSFCLVFLYLSKIALLNKNTSFLTKNFIFLFLTISNKHQYQNEIAISKNYDFLIVFF